MIKTDELSNPASCLNKAADDEPIFTLRANDPLAPVMVRMWAEHYIASKTDARGQCPPENAFKFHEALRCASLMDAWKEEQKRREACPEWLANNRETHAAAVALVTANKEQLLMQTQDPRACGPNCDCYPVKVRA